MQIDQMEKRPGYLACFIRYGFFVLFAVILYALKMAGASRNVIIGVFGSMLLVYGVYFMLGLQFKFKHLYKAVHNVYYHTSQYDAKRLDKDIKINGVFYAAIGIVGAIALYFRL